MEEGKLASKEAYRPEMLTPQDLAGRWQVPSRTLGQWRYQGSGPGYVKIGGAVRYRLADVEAYEAEHFTSHEERTA